jgi:hypothetical protein
MMISFLLLLFVAFLFRKTAIEMILATELKQHMVIKCQVESRIKTVPEDPFQPDKKPNDYTLMMQLLLMCCDISNGLRPTHIATRWTQRIFEENWLQGDKETAYGFTPSKLTDRSITSPQNNANGQVSELIIEKKIKIYIYNKRKFFFFFFRFSFWRILLFLFSMFFIYYLSVSGHVFEIFNVCFILIWTSIFLSVMCSFYEKMFYYEFMNNIP